MIDYVKLIGAEGRTFTLRITELKEDAVFYCHDDTSCYNLEEDLKAAIDDFIERDNELKKLYAKLLLLKSQ